MPNKVGAMPEPSSGAMNACDLLEFGDVGLAGLVEGRGRENEDRGIDQEREHQRDRRIDALPA